MYIVELSSERIREWVLIKINNYLLVTLEDIGSTGGICATNYPIGCGPIALHPRLINTYYVRVNVPHKR
jgi:hypothetical protein